MIAATPASSKRCARSIAVSSTRLGPAFDGDPAALGVDADRDAAGKCLARRADERRIAHGDRAEDDPRDALAEPGLDRREIADAAAELGGDGDAREDAFDRRGIRRLARERAIEIDDVQVLETLVLKGAAWAPGSSLKTLAELISPSWRRTHCPSLRSIAGNRITNAFSLN